MNRQETSIIAAVLLLCTPALEASVGKVATKDGFTQIESVAPLTWDKSGQTTFIGALTSAANAMGIETDYVQLMGDSSLAFRTRWFRTDEGAKPTGWCPSSPVGEMAPWDRRAAAAIGVKLNFKFDMDKEKIDMAQYAPQVKSSIDAGRPVLAYADKLDMAVIYGYADDGKTVLFRDYYHGDKTFSMKLADTKGLLAFIENPDQLAKPVISPRDNAIKALKAAVGQWKTEPDPFTSRGRTGAYLMGESAYAEWIDNLKNAEKFTEEERKGLFQPSWWTFCVLADARQAAVEYLKRSTAHFDGAAKAALERATGHYQQSAKAAGQVFGKKEIFLGPWSGKKIEDWTPEVRAKEAALLETMREHDGKAIEEIEKALEAMK